MRHAGGRTFVPDGVQRIATVGLADELLFIGVTPVGEVGSWGSRFLPHQQPFLEDATYLGGEHLPHAVRLEAVFAARPDLIIAEVALADTARALADIAPTVVLRDAETHPEARVRDLGAILGVEARAEAALAWRRRKLAAAREVLGATLDGQTVGVLRVQLRRLKVYGARWFCGPTLYDDLGLRPPTLVAERVGRGVNAWLPLELLPDFDADHLFLMVAPAPGIRSALEGVAESPAWRLMPAARRGDVHTVDIHHWLGGGVMARSLVVDDLLRILAPEAIAAGRFDGLLGPRPPASP